MAVTVNAANRTPRDVFTGTPTVTTRIGTAMTPVVLSTGDLVGEPSTGG